MKRAIKIVLKMAGVLAVLLLVLLLLLQTAWGRRTLASALSNALGRSGATTVRIGRIDGWIPFRASVESVEIGDRDGTWLVVRGLRWRWDFQDAVRGRIRLLEPGADEVELIRLPAATERRGESWLADANIELLGCAVDRLKLGRGVAGLPLEYALRSESIVLADGIFSGDVSVSGYGVEGSAHMTASNGIWSVEIPGLKARVWDVATVSIKGRLDPERVELSAELAEFELADLPFPLVSGLEGRVGGSLSIAGASASPEAMATLSISRFGVSSKLFEELPKLEVRMVGEASNGRLSASLSVAGFDPGYLAAKASMPCVFSIVPFRAQPEPGKMAGSLEAVFDLDVFNGLAAMENQRVEGVLTAELDVKDGAPSGFVSIENGSYEHYEWGLYIRDFDAVLEPVPSGFAVVKAVATDGGAGRLGLSGGMEAGTLAMVLDLSKAHIVRRPEVEATLSGRLALAGPWSRPGLTGRLTVDRADLLPDNLASAKPPLLVDFDIDSPEVSNRGPVSRKPLPFDLDLWIDLADQIRVNASLIDSVWGGSLRVLNSEEGLSFSGKMEPRRGYVDFVGKKFRLVDGSVELDGSVQRVPVLNNLTAEYSRSDIVARLILNGPVDRPQYLLESTPALPEDEILSQVLFKRDVGSITPYQAVQLAAAAQQLSSGLGGPGFLYQFRQAVGMDTFEWRESGFGSGSSSVAAGKYLTPELYIEVSSTLGEEAQTGLMLEYDVNRHFSIETTTGPRMRPGIGLNWKKDY